MKNNLLIAITIVSLLSGCTKFDAKVPMASYLEDVQAKKFDVPTGNYSGLYIYRDLSYGLGAATKRILKIDNNLIGESAPYVYFYKQITPGKHIVTTGYESSYNTIQINTEKGKNYCLRNYIRLGIVGGGANLEKIELEKCKEIIQDFKRAADFR